MKGFRIFTLVSILVVTSCSTFSEEEKQAYTAKGNEISQKAFKALSSEAKAKAPRTQP